MSLAAQTAAVLLSAMPLAISIAPLTTAAMLGTCGSNAWARTASLDSVGCAYDSSNAWHMVPYSSIIDCAYGGSIAWAQDASLDINSCAYDSSITWHGVLCSISLAALMAAASLGSMPMAALTAAPLLGTWCLAPYHWLHLRRQHCSARGTVLVLRWLRSRRQLGLWHRLPRAISLQRRHC